MSVARISDCQRQINASEANLEASRFDDVRLGASRFHNAMLDRCTFDTIDMSGCTFENVTFTNARLIDCSYEGMTIEGIPVELLLQHYRSTVAA
jgi:uncharacterized protein YjbI with pentapeptide repeats